jgi:hypothetical protein
MKVNEVVQNWNSLHFLTILCPVLMSSMAFDSFQDIKRESVSCAKGLCK